jgi:A/G-specific adenine glycosylase
MLQQTRVDAVIPYYLRFLERFPTLEALAEADVAEVLKSWEGLGYYRRARALREGAVRIVAMGRWPESAEGLRAIPGIGPYTAGAIASIAFGERAPVVDGNIRRVWARVFGLEEVHSAEAQRKLWALSDEAVLHGSPGEVNQALMELGATLCSPGAPNCAECPMRAFCLSFQDGHAGARPLPRAKRPVPTYEVAVGLLWVRGRFFVQRRPEEGLLGGLWELPGGKLREGETPEEALVRELKEETGAAVRITGALRPVRHAYSHFRVVLHPFHCAPTEGTRPPRSGPSGRWLRADEIASLPFPAATLKIFRGALSPRAETEKAAEEPAAYHRT